MLDKLFGSSIVEDIGRVADKLFTSDDERLTHAELMERLRQRPHLAQADITRVEAGHRSVWVAGWRPAIGWTCAASLGYHFIAHPLLAWALAVLDPTVPVPPDIDTAPLMTLVLAMLGLGGMRTVEKARGLTK